MFIASSEPCHDDDKTWLLVQTQVKGSNPALGKQWSRDYPIDVPATPTQLRSPILTFATKKLSTGANGQREDAAKQQLPSFVRAV